MSVTNGGTALKPLRMGGSLSGSAGSGPDRGRQVLEADDAIDEAVGLGRIVRGAQLEHELVLGAEIDLLEVLALGEVPEVQAPAVFGAEQDFRHEPVLECVGRAPFARHQGVVAEVPPDVVAQPLRPALHFPAAERLEALMIDHEDAARRLAVHAAERSDIDAAGTAMHRVRPGVAGFLRDLLGFDDFDDLRLARVGLGVEDMNARGPQPRHH